MGWNLLGNANHAASRAGSGISGSLAKLVATLAKIIYISVNNNSAANDGVLPSQGDHGVCDVNLCRPTGCLHIAQISSVSLSLGICGSSMGRPIKIKMRPGTGAAIGVVAKLS